MDWRKQVAAGVFVVLALVLFGYVVHIYSSSSNDYSSILNLTSQQIAELKKCAPEEAETIARSTDLICEPQNERKHSITILSAYPNEDSNIIRNIYESATGISTYTPYLEIDDTHSKACSFQSGPWELYCRGSPDCFYQHPPGWDIPYFVKTVYPLYGEICDIYGYDLVTHDKVIHIVHNPVDAIYAWKQKDFSGNLTLSNFIVQYKDWHNYWKEYEYNYPDTPVYWFRFEDFCLCKEQIMEQILVQSGIRGIDIDTIKKSIDDHFECDLRETLGTGISM